MTHEGRGTPSGPSDETFDVEDLPSPEVKPYDPEPQREKLRGYLAGGLVLLLAVIVLLAFGTMWSKWASEAEIKDLLSTIFPPLVALAGTAIGFYFGGRAR